jgi:metallophosphoesterase (TIGR03768 family)
LTTVERQVRPLALPANVLPITPDQVSLYEPYGYSAWLETPGLGSIKRFDLAAGHESATNAARLLTFFTISDIHLADKESPAQTLYVGISSPLIPANSGMMSAYSPTILATTHVLDAAMQTVNALHRRTPFNFGISLGDDTNNTQYNELRWFIDVLDGKVITPSSGAHAGADTIDYQKPYQAEGLNPAIPWYQTIGNHDQFWMGSAFENTKTRAAHVGSAVMNAGNSTNPTDGSVNQQGFYVGVVDGNKPYGDVIKYGPVGDYTVAPTVVADPDRHSNSTETSTRLNWMKEFFNTTSTPMGHGFSQANLDQDFASYSFHPKEGLPLKVIVLDDTCNGPNEPNYAAGCLDTARETWLRNELDAGQTNDELMIIAAHIPILPATSLTDPTPMPVSWLDAQAMMTALHGYPNLVLWIAGHRHVNVVTPQPSSDPVNHPEQAFWEVETPSLKDFPQQFRTFDLRRNDDGTLSILVVDVDPAVREGSPAYASRGHAIGSMRVFGASQATSTNVDSQAYNAELVKVLTPRMQAKLATLGTPLQ